MSAYRILLAEDEPAIADTLLYALQREGWQVRHCTLARDAEAALAAEPPQLLILSSGELTPFTLRLAGGRERGAPVLLLVSDGFAEPALQQEKSR